MRVLVIGDSCTDMFRYGVCDRLSPEAPVPIFKPTNIKVNGGMAINVCDNIISLGVDCDIITNDIRPVKTRLVDEISNQILIRIDENDYVDEITEETLKKIKFEQYDAIVISDYNKGFLSEEAIEYISQQHNVVLMDTKKKIDSWAKDIDLIKINEKEFMNNSEWLTRWFEGELIVTYGGKGAKRWFSELISIENEHPVRDLSGAGDTFLAAFVVDYLKNNNLNEAIRFANKCASWVVTQRGVVVINSNI